MNSGHEFSYCCTSYDGFDMTMTLAKLKQKAYVFFYTFTLFEQKATQVILIYSFMRLCMKTLCFYYICWYIV